MKKLIRDATITYQLSNINKNKKGLRVASKNIKQGTIDMLVVCKDIEEASKTRKILFRIAKQHKKTVDDVHIIIKKIEFGSYEHWSHDVY